MTAMKWIILILVILMYALIIAFQDKKVIFSTSAAIIVVLLGMIFPNTIFPLPEDLVAHESGFLNHTYALTHSLFEAINWNVIMIYLGSMAIASMFLYSGVPAKIADDIISKSKNTGLAMVAILAMTGIISIFVENVATVLVMAPIALALCKKLKINPTYFMIGLAVMSNLEGTATLVGDPPSMIFASYAGYNFNDFFFHAGKFSIFWIVQTGLLAGCIYFYCYFAKNGKNKIEVEGSKVISYVPFALLLIMIFGLAMISFIPTNFGYGSGLFVLALGIISMIWYKVTQNKSMTEVKDKIKELDWETIFFLLGIFIVIRGIQDIGLLNDFAHVLAGWCNGSKLLGFILILIVSIVISGFVDNVPYIIAMLPVAGAMAAEMGINGELFMFALLVGSCLGGNLTPYGASANVVAMGIVKNEGYPMNFGKWLKVGVPFTLITTAAAALLLWIIWA